jgi:hypothetical protein
MCGEKPFRVREIRESSDGTVFMIKSQSGSET